MNLFVTRQLLIHRCVADVGRKLELELLEEDEDEEEENEDDEEERRS